MYQANKAVPHLLRLVERMAFYGERVEEDPSFCRIVNSRHFHRLSGLIDASLDAGAEVAFGGERNEDERFVAPTILRRVAVDMSIMREEIFGPVLPVVTYQDLSQAMNLIRSFDKPLAAYFFASDKKRIRRFREEISCGGMCINDCLLHAANHNLPFGGVGPSGIGSYHGYHGFRAFSHEKSVLMQSKRSFTCYFYPPYNRKVARRIKKLMGFA